MNLLKLIALEAKKKIIDGSYIINYNTRISPSYNIDDSQRYVKTYNGSLNMLFRLMMSKVLKIYQDANYISIYKELNSRGLVALYEFEQVLFNISYGNSFAAKVPELRNLMDLSIKDRALIALNLIIEKGENYYR